MRANRRSDKEQQRFEARRNDRQQRRMLDDTGGVQWERPTYMSQIGIPTAAAHTPGNYRQYLKESLKPGQMLVDESTVRPNEIMLPGTGFGYGTIHGTFLNKHCRNIESRLWGLGLNHPFHPAKEVNPAPIAIPTLHIAPALQQVTIEPVRISTARPLLW